MGVFRVFQIIQMVPNRTKRLICLTNMPKHDSRVQCSIFALKVPNDSSSFTKLRNVFHNFGQKVTYISVPMRRSLIKPYFSYSKHL